MAYIVEYKMGNLRYWVQAFGKNYQLNGLLDNATPFHDDLTFLDIQKKLASFCDVRKLEKIDTKSVKWKKKKAVSSSDAELIEQLKRSEIS